MVRSLRPRCSVRQSRRSNVRVGSHTKPFPRVALGDRLARYLRCSRRSRCTSFSLPEDIVARVVARVERAHPFDRLEAAKTAFVVVACKIII
jgi:hypothetical protein